MAKNNPTGDKLKFQDLPGVDADKKLTATEFNRLPAWQNSPVQQITGSLNDTDIIIDGTKNYLTTIAVAGATRTITANATGHLQGNSIKQRYTFAVDCTITLALFDTPGNNTGTITPIPAGTYDIIYESNRNGINILIPQNVASDAVRSEPNTWYLNDINGNDSNVGSANFPFENIQAAHDAAAANDTIIIQNIFYDQSSGDSITITKTLVIKGVAGNTGAFTRLAGTWTISAGVDIWFENVTIRQATFDGPGIFTIYLNDCSTDNLQTGTSRFMILDAQTSNIIIGTAANLRILKAYNCQKITGNLSIGSLVELFESTVIGNLISGLDSSQPMTLYNSTINGDVTVTGNLSKFNSVITGTETASGTKINRQAKVFDDPVEFKTLAHANNDTNAVKTFTATPTFAFGVDGQAQQMTLTGNVTTFATSGEVGSANMDVYLINDGTPGRTVVAPTGWTVDPTSETHTTAANAINRYQFYTLPDGSKYFNNHIVKA